MEHEMEYEAIPALNRCHGWTWYTGLDKNMPRSGYKLKINIISEIRGGISAPTAMVWSETEVRESIALWISKCHSSSRGHLAARHVLYHAWWLQRSHHTNAFRLKNLSQRNNQLFDEVRNWRGNREQKSNSSQIKVLLNPPSSLSLQKTLNIIMSGESQHFPVRRSSLFVCTGE